MVQRLHASLKDHFIPHEGNGHVPHVLKHHVLVGYGLIAILLKIAVVAVPIALPSSSAWSSSITPANVVSLTNGTRRALGLAELKANDLLAAAAAEKAKDMLANRYFAHTSPSGLTGFALIRQAGYQYRFAGENLAVHYESAEGVTEGWLASPTHKANIVNPRFKEIGVGVARGEFEGYPSTIVVQLFGEPATAVSPKPSAASESDAPAPAVTITPAPKGYEVTVNDGAATGILAVLAGQAMPLAKSADGTWRGTVPLDAAAVGTKSQTISLVTASAGTPAKAEAVATVLPAAAPAHVYGFAAMGRPAATVLGLNVGDLDDEARRFYLYAVLFLLGATALSVAAKYRHRHLPRILHAIVIASLGIGLMTH